MTCHNSFYEKILQHMFSDDGLHVVSQSFALSKSATSHPRLKYNGYRYLIIMNNSPFYRVFAQAAVQVYKCVLMHLRV